MNKTKLKYVPGPCETLARLALQTTEYHNTDLKEAVNNVLGFPLFDSAPDLLRVCKNILTRLLNIKIENKAIMTSISELKMIIARAERSTYEEEM